MGKKHIQTIGLVRFSVVTTDYFSETHGSLDALKAHLFSPARLALRFNTFETLCLPSLIRQSDRDFRLVVLTSKDLPAEARARLDALIAPHDNIDLIAAAPDAHYQIIKRAYASAHDPKATHRLLFRLDDDDALSLDYIARLKAIATPLCDLQPHRPTAIGFQRGFYIEMTGQGGNTVFDATERAPLSCGTALLKPADYERNPYRYNHRALGQHYSLYSDISAPVFLRTIHGDNKSSPAKLGLTRQMRQSEVKQELSRRFGFALKDLRRLK